MQSVYCTADQVKGYLYGIDLSSLTKAGASIDFLISQFMPIAAADMDRFMRQTLNEETLEDQRFDGSGTINLVIPNWPIKTVSKCVINYGWGSGLYTFQNFRHKASRLLGLPADISDQRGDLIIDRDKGIVSINPSSLTLVSQQGNISPLWNWIFTEGTANVVMTYIHGFATPPLDVAACQAMYTAVLIGEMAGGRVSGGATTIKIGTVTRTWANKPYEALFSTWMRLIEGILDNYQVREAEF